MTLFLNSEVVKIKVIRECYSLLYQLIKYPVYEWNAGCCLRTAWFEFNNLHYGPQKRRNTENVNDVFVTSYKHSTNDVKALYRDCSFSRVQHLLNSKKKWYDTTTARAGHSAKRRDYSPFVPCCYRNCPPSLLPCLSYSLFAGTLSITCKHTEK